MNISCGKFTMCVIAKEGYHNTPVESDLALYNSYEVAIWEGWGPYLSPAELGIQGFPNWRRNNVGMNITPNDIQRLKEALAKL